MYNMPVYNKQYIIIRMRLECRDPSQTLRKRHENQSWYAYIQHYGRQFEGAAVKEKVQ